MAITTLEQLKKYSEGSEVELPGFVEREPITVKLKRPSLMMLAQDGIIPNTLLGAASDLFKNGVTSSMKDGEAFKQTSETLIKIARASLISPTYEDFEKAGLSLTDIQLIFIYNFSQTGVNSLKSFREE